MTTTEPTRRDDDPAARPERLVAFDAEIEKLQVSGGQANREKTGLTIAVVLFVGAVALEVVAFIVSSGATDTRDQTDMIILALLGVVLALGAVGLFVRNALTRWFRYWLVRLIFEDRSQTDRLIEVLREETTSGSARHLR